MKQLFSYLLVAWGSVATVVAAPDKAPIIEANAVANGRRRTVAAIGLINLICNLARYEQIERLKRLPRNAA